MQIGGYRELYDRFDNNVGTVVGLRPTGVKSSPIFSNHSLSRLRKNQELWRLYPYYQFRQLTFVFEQYKN